MDNEEKNAFEEKVNQATLMPEPDPEFARRLWKQIENQAHNPEQNPSLFRGLLSRPAWGVGILVILVAIIAFFLFRTPTVNAQEILQRAQLTANDMVAAGVESFEMISETNTAADIPAGFATQPDETGEYRSRIHTWFQAPDHWRYEHVFLEGQDKEPLSTPSVTVTDGVSIWTYDPEMNLVQIHDGNLNGPGKSGGVSPYGAAVGMGGVIGQAAECFDPELVGQDEIIAGRKTYRIELGPSHCPGNASAGFAGPQTLWIDQETFFILKTVIRDLNDERDVYVMEVSEIQYNTTLSADLFTFSPPPGAQVKDERSSAQPTETAMPLPTSTPLVTPDNEGLLSATATPQLPFQPLLPTWLPEGVGMTTRVETDGAFITIVFDPLPNEPSYSFHSLTLQEIPLALIIPGGTLPTTTTVEQIGEFQVTVLAGGESCTTYIWDVGEIQLQLINPMDVNGQPRYTCDQMEKIVESIK